MGKGGVAGAPVVLVLRNEGGMRRACFLWVVCGWPPSHVEAVSRRWLAKQKWGFCWGKTAP